MGRGGSTASNHQNRELNKAVFVGKQELNLGDDHMIINGLVTRAGFEPATVPFEVISWGMCSTIELPGTGKN